MEKELKISGMSCHHCIHAVKSSLAAVAGIQVKEVRIGSATVDADPEVATDEAIRLALEEEGYRLEGAA